ncbi:MAG: peptidase domain-containing ABC transporter [Defluviitaleaceae bacterium]|nr:peptidase domain-containing ABC transporter [Defluviitaleaceae bacterium]
MPKKYYTILQHDITDCGAACIATISKQHGLKIPITQIREIAGTDKQGTNAAGIIKAAEELGFMAKGVKGDKEAFFSPFPLPCIAHVVVKGNLMHYVVVHKITQKQIIISDPGVGIVKLTPAEFFGETGEDIPTYRWSGVLIFVVPGTTFQKGDKTTGIFKRFFHLLLPQKKLIIHVFVASLIYTLLGILAAFYFSYLLDEILPGSLSQTLHILSVGIIILNVFMVVLNAFRSHLLLYLSQKLDISLILGYYRHVISLPMNFFSTRKVGEIIARFNDASHVRDAISGATLTIMIDTLMVIAGAVVLYLQNPLMFGVTVIIALIYLVIVWSFNSLYRTLNRKQMEDNAQLTSYLVESLNGIQAVKSYNAEHEANLSTEKKFVAMLKSIFKLSWVSNVQSSLTGLVELIGGVIILWIGAYNVINGNLTVGQLITFNALLVYFLGPVKNLIDLQPMMQTAIVAADRLGEILDLEPEKTAQEVNKLNLPTLIGDIEAKNLTFRYGTRHNVLENVNFKIKKGEKAAFVGESGSGKTTIAKLLLKLYEQQQGEILINDTNIKDVKIDVIREKIAYVAQETFLFSDSIMKNLMIGLDVSPEEVIEACKMAKAHDFINDFPLRYETYLEENGSNLSGGQRQRLAIARALLKKPDILILDEATSNLDSITERAIEETINKYTKNITTIIIAHRLSTIKRCDKIFVTDKGCIVESGTHTELIEKKGLYYNLVYEQSLEID